MAFKVGDKVRVKSFEDIVKDVEADEDGDYLLKYSIPDGGSDKLYFCSSMRIFCGEVYTIKQITNVEGLIILCTSNGEVLRDDEDSDAWLWAKEWLIAYENTKFVTSFSDDGTPTKRTFEDIQRDMAKLVKEAYDLGFIEGFR
jgi:hypothetical protein